MEKGVKSQLCECQEAARASVQSYEHHGYAVVVHPLMAGEDGCQGQLVVVPAIRHVDAVLDAGTDFAPVKDELTGLALSGWATWAVVPLGRLGEAHSAFLGSAERVQGWWPQPSNSRSTVGFTEPQVP